jgi:glycosyltransferase involved in cell wall biosynthesis
MAHPLRPVEIVADDSALSVRTPGPVGEIVHEWLAKYGGSENVIESIRDIFPSARLTCLWNDAPERFHGNVRETWLARTQLRRSKVAALPAMPSTWRHLGPSSAEWILCSSHLFAHHARFRGAARDARKLVYAYTPARYIWTPEDDPRGAGVMARSAAPALRALDRKRAREAYAVAGISRFVAERISRSWDREATVIYPPVDSRAIIAGSEFEPELTVADQEVLDHLPSEFVLGASRFVPYKKLDIAIAAGKAAGLPVIIAGDGPDAERLRWLAEQAPVPVTFVSRPSTSLLRAINRRATVFVFVALEDFGIMPVESMAAGVGVVALDRGGTAETVIDGETGALVSSFDPTELKMAVERAAQIDPQRAKERALEFDIAEFELKMKAWVTG